eukprot:4919755-Prymnesium_polylepis.1
MWRHVSVDSIACLGGWLPVASLLASLGRRQPRYFAVALLHLVESCDQSAPSPAPPVREDSASPCPPARPRLGTPPRVPRGVAHNRAAPRASAYPHGRVVFADPSRANSAQSPAHPPITAPHTTLAYRACGLFARRPRVAA